MVRRDSAAVVGLLLILGIVTSLVSSTRADSVLDNVDYLAAITGHETRALFGVVFQFLPAAIAAGIAIGPHAVQAVHHPGLALGAVGFRVIEGVFDAVSALDPPSLLALSQGTAGATDAGATQVLGGANMSLTAARTTCSPYSRSARATRCTRWCGIEPGWSSGACRSGVSPDRPDRDDRPDHAVQREIGRHRRRDAAAGRPDRPAGTDPGRLLVRGWTGPPRPDAGARANRPAPPVVGPHRLTPAAHDGIAGSTVSGQTTIGSYRPSRSSM